MGLTIRASYLCNKKKPECKDHCVFPGSTCQHTLDPQYAKNGPATLAELISKNDFNGRKFKFLGQFNDIEYYEEIE